MSHLDEMKERLEIGVPILNELFKLNSKELKEKIRSILGDVWISEHCSGIIENGSVTKTLTDDEPKRIQIFYYDEIEITWYGIWWKPEHGTQTCIKEFDKHFKL